MNDTTLRNWRHRLALDQGQAADALGIARRTYQYYERGVRPIPRAVALATITLEMTEHAGKETAAVVLDNA